MRITVSVPLYDTSQQRNSPGAYHVKNRLHRNSSSRGKPGRIMVKGAQLVGQKDEGKGRTLFQNVEEQPLILFISA